MFKTSACQLFSVAALAAISSGCRYGDGTSTSSIESEREALVAQYRNERERVLTQDYEPTKFGDIERCVNLLELTTNTYERVLSWRMKMAQSERGKRVANETKRFCARWLSVVDEGYEHADGSYVGIFHADEWMIFYNKAIYRLLMSRSEAERWKRIENTTWSLLGKRIVFSNGCVCAKLPWRLFEPKPYLKEKEWIVLVDEKSVFSANGADYAIVWFASKGNLIGNPTTTEERVFVEIKGNRISRYVGLHNVLDSHVSLSQDNKYATIQAISGYDTEVRFVIDVQTMKIVQSRSMLPPEFERDGYGRKFLAGNATVGQK